MKKEVVVICLAALALAGCGNTGDGEPSGAMVTQHEALFGETGGDPWSGTQAFMATNPTSGHKFGRTLTVADLSFSGKAQIITSSGKVGAHGFVSTVSRTGTVTDYSMNRNNVTIEDNFGYAVLAGKFCPDLVTGDIVVTTAPDFNNGKSGFYLIHRLNGTSGGERRVQVREAFNPPMVTGGRAGTVIAVGDLNGDGKQDLVYQSRPIDSANNYLSSTVSVITDFCSRSGTVTDILSIPDPSVGRSLVGFGSALYVVDLDKSGTSELVVVDSEYRSSGNTNKTAEGAIFFYKQSGDKLVESRKPLIGALGTSGASINAVAFSDVNRDGLVDLVVGEPLYVTKGTREGRVRTYLNPGKGGSFDASATPLWEATGGGRNYRFGTSVLIDDLNNDGVDDLIVGAPGWRSTGNGTGNDSARIGYVYVFMGTNDGTGFSKTPIKTDPLVYAEDTQYKADSFWHATSGASSSIGDSFGLQIATIDFDGKGWKDIVVSAPGYGPSKDDRDQGRVHVFVSDADHCYTAEKCMVGEKIADDQIGNYKCYDAGAQVGKSSCTICDPSQHNFDLSLKTCDYDKTNKCISGAVCDDTKGCVEQYVADGTSCGSTACNTSNAVVKQMCKSGVCTKSETACGDYACDVKSASCLTRCNSDADCTGDLICKSNKCVVQPPNQAPVAVIAEKQYIASPGTTVTIDATKSSDPDKDTITFLWTGDTQYLSSTTSSKPKFKVPEDAVEGTVYYLTLKVTDPYKLSDEAKTEIVVHSDVVNNPPIVTVNYPDEVEPGESVQLEALAYDPDGDELKIGWSGTGSAYLSSTSIYNPVFTAPTDAIPGTEYALEFYAMDREDSGVSIAFSIAIKEPKPNGIPEISLADEFIYTPGEKLVLDATRTSDPDGDKLSFSWTVNGKGGFSDATIPNPEFSILDAVDNSSSVVTLTVTDGKDTVSKSATITTVVPDDSSIIITKPTSTTVISTKATIEGYAYPDTDVVVIDAETGKTVCGANSDPHDGEFRCIISLEEGPHTFIAYMLNSYGGQLAKTVVSDVFASSVTLDNPVDDSVYSESYAIIYSGTAEPGTAVEVHLLPDEIVTCTATTDLFGYWSCDDSSYHAPGYYEAYAIDRDLADIYEGADTNGFTIINGTSTTIPNDGIDARGGSCSISTTSRTGFAPFALLACCAALLISRRRRVSKNI